MQKFTEEELTLFVNAVNGNIGCDPNFFIAEIRAELDYDEVVGRYEIKEDLMVRLASMRPTDLAELASRCADFWKSPYSITDTRTRMFEVGLIQNFGIQ